MTHYFLRKMSSDQLKCGPTPSYALFMTTPLPQLPQLPHLPQLPQLPQLSHLPHLPHLPQSVNLTLITPY